VSKSLTVPVVLIVFNRPDLTSRVLAEISKVKPRKLLVIADGPRVDQPGEAERCAETRAMIEKVDWDCEVFKNYTNMNLGCRGRLVTGLNWVFDMVEEAIVLEDDCLPHPTFFPFCQQLLEHYRHDNRIMTISGNNFQFGRKRTNYSYYFSRYPHIWGWASWRRAWKLYDANLKLWPEIREQNWLFDILGNARAVNFWRNVFDLTYIGRIDTWDYQLTFSSWLQNGLHILPNVNLVSNIGFGQDATHSTQINRFAYMPVAAINFPLTHPPFMIRDHLADEYTQANNFGLID